MMAIVLMAAAFLMVVAAGKNLVAAVSSPHSGEREGVVIEGVRMKRYAALMGLLVALVVCVLADVVSAQSPYSGETFLVETVSEEIVSFENEDDTPAGWNSREYRNNEPRPDWGCGSFYGTARAAHSPAPITATLVTTSTLRGYWQGSGQILVNGDQISNIPASGWAEFEISSRDNTTTVSSLGETVEVSTSHTVSISIGLYGTLVLDKVEIVGHHEYPVRGRVFLPIQALPVWTSPYPAPGDGLPAGG